MTPIQKGNEALAAALQEHIEQVGMTGHQVAQWFIDAAKDGRYYRSTPVNPLAIKMTPDQFNALRALAYQTSRGNP